MLQLLIPGNREDLGPQRSPSTAFPSRLTQREMSGLEPTVHGSTLEDSHSHITSPSGVRVGLHSELASKSGKYFFSLSFSSHYYLVFVLTWKWYTVSSGWARGLFSVCQATLMMGIKSWGGASQLDRKPSHRVLVGLGTFFLPPNGKILAWGMV